MQALPSFPVRSPKVLVSIWLIKTQWIIGRNTWRRWWNKRPDQSSPMWRLSWGRHLPLRNGKDPGFSGLHSAAACHPGRAVSWVCQDNDHNSGALSKVPLSQHRQFQRWPSHAASPSSERKSFLSLLVTGMAVFFRLRHHYYASALVFTWLSFLWIWINQNYHPHPPCTHLYTAVYKCLCICV